MESVPGEEEKWGGGRGSRQLKGKGQGVQGNVDTPALLGVNTAPC